MKASEELREKMWELCYDLLPDDERRALVATIKSDPHVARLYAEVRLQADLVGYASKVEDSSLILSPEGRKTSETELAPAAAHKAVLQPPASHPKAAPHVAGKQSWVAWLPAVAALCLLALIGYGTLRPNVGPPQLADAFITEVELPGQMEPGLTNKIVLRSRRVEGEPAPVEIDVKLVDQAGQVQHHEVVQSDEKGLAEIQVPGQAVTRGMRLEATARSEGLARDGYGYEGYLPSSGTTPQTKLPGTVSAALPVSADQPLAYVIQDIPRPQPGQEMKFAMYSVSRFGLIMQPAPVEDMVVKNLKEGSPVVRPMWNTADGVVEGTFQLPSDQPPGQLALSTRGGDNEGERLAGFVGQKEQDEAERLDQLHLTRQQDAQLAKLYYRESIRRNVQQLETRLVEAKQSAGQELAKKDVPAEANLLAEGKEKTSEQAAAAEKLEPEKNAATKEQVAAKRLKNELGDHSSAGETTKKSDSANDTTGATWTANSSQKSFVRDLASEPTIVAAGAPVTMTVPAELSGKRLLVEAMCRDVTVAATTVEPAGVAAGSSTAHSSGRLSDEARASGERQVTIHLPPEADGDIRLKLVDDSLSPPQVVREERLYRRPTRELKLALADGKNEFQPGEKVTVRFQVLSELDQPEPALLGVRVWSEAEIQASGQEPVMLADYVRSQSALYETESQTRGLARKSKVADRFDRPLAMQSPAPQTADLKKADGAILPSGPLSPGSTLERSFESLPKGAAAPAPAPGASPAPDGSKAPAIDPATNPAADAPALPVASAVVAPAYPPPPPTDLAAAPAPTDPQATVAEKSRGDAATALDFGSGGAPAEPSPRYARSVGGADLEELTEAIAPLAPQVISNRIEVERLHRDALAQSKSDWESWRAIVGRVLVIGGIVALAGLLLLFLVRQPVRAGGGTLTLLAAAASLIVGAFWIADGRQAVQIAGLPAAVSEPSAPRGMAAPFDRLESFAGGMDGKLRDNSAPNFAEQRAELDDMQDHSLAKDETRLRQENPSAPQEQRPGLAQMDKEPFNFEDSRKSLELGGQTGGGSLGASGSGRAGGFGGGKAPGGGGGFGGAGGGLEAAPALSSAGATKGGSRASAPMPADADVGLGGPAMSKMPGDNRNRDKKRLPDSLEGAEVTPPPAPSRTAALGAPAGRGGQRPADEATPLQTDALAAPASAPATAAGENPEGDKGTTANHRGTAAAQVPPVSLYFNPRLATDANGYATIEFQMPDAEADYRILIDAFGHGRIGSAEMLIMCRK